MTLSEKMEVLDKVDREI